MVTGSFGPAKNTTVVITWDIRGAGSYHGFALVPDAKSAHGFRELPLPALPRGVLLDGTMKTALVANLDKDRGDELVLQLSVDRTGGSKAAGYFGYTAATYVVLHWNGKRFVRLAALERRLSRAQHVKGRVASDPLSDSALRTVLHVAR